MRAWGLSDPVRGSFKGSFKGSVKASFKSSFKGSFKESGWQVNSLGADASDVAASQGGDRPLWHQQVGGFCSCFFKFFFGDGCAGYQFFVFRLGKFYTGMKRRGSRD